MKFAIRCSSLQIHPIQASPIKVPFTISFHLSYLPMLPFDFEVKYVVRDFNCRCNSPATLAGSHMFFCWYIIRILLEQSTYGVRGIMVNWCFIRLCHLVATFWWRELKKVLKWGPLILSSSCKSFNLEQLFRIHLLHTSFQSFNLFFFH